MGAAFMVFSATSGSTPTITAQDKTGTAVARLNVRSTGRSSRDFHLARTLLTSGNATASADAAPIATSTHHSLTGKCDLVVHGQRMTLRQSWEGMRSGKDLDTPQGKWSWRTGGSTMHAVEELTEERTGRLVARCRIPTFGKGDRRLEILEPMEEVLVDAVVVSWIVMLNE